LIQERILVRAELIRANTYSLLAALFARSPTAKLLDRLLTIFPVIPDVDSLAHYWRILKLAAEKVSVEELDDEFHSLFIGVGHGEVIPYGSWYLCGRIMDKPLALLRKDLAQLGFEAQPEVREPEDHVAALCETMALMNNKPTIPLETQRSFFQTHIGTWVITFFRDLQKAPSARFYKAVGGLGERFMEFERHYFSLP
jgi:TorA maturation chaperone TorD